MKRNVKKMTLNRETLRDLETVDLTKVDGASATLCTPTYVVSCRYPCPHQPPSGTTCK